MSHLAAVTHVALAHGLTFEGSHPCDELHTAIAPLIPLTIDQFSADFPGKSVDGQPLVIGEAATGLPLSKVHPSLPDDNDWLRLRIWAEMFDDAQKSRIAMVNRAERGGVDPVVFGAFVAQMDAAEKVAKNGLLTTYKDVVPEALRQYQKDTRGIGEHLFGRLLGHLGHPIHTTPKWWENKVLVAGEPMERTLGQLMQYCGHGAPTVRRKGISQAEAMWNGNPQCKMVLHLLSEAVVKTGNSHLRDVYDEARAVEHIHTVECVRCGPSGKPALVGSPWSKAHSHAHGMRMIGKQILRDMYEVCTV